MAWDIPVPLHSPAPHVVTSLIHIVLKAEYIPPMHSYSSRLYRAGTYAIRLPLYTRNSLCPGTEHEGIYKMSLDLPINMMQNEDLLAVILVQVLALQFITKLA